MVAWNSVSLPQMDETAKQNLMREVKLLHTLKHANILEFRGAFVHNDKKDIVFITEILEGSLKDFIKKGIPVRWVVVKKWMRDILKGLEYLHTQDPPIVHRDVKCDNVFIDKSQGHIRIGDLGLARHRSEEEQNLTVLGTPAFMAPEMFAEGGTYGTKIDIYAAGMVLIEILTQEYPYMECNSTPQVMKAIIEGTEPKVMELIQYDPALEFINACRMIDPERRPSATELLKSNNFIAGKDEASDQQEVPISAKLRGKPAPAPPAAAAAAAAAAPAPAPAPDPAPPAVAPVAAAPPALPGASSIGAQPAASTFGAAAPSAESQ